MKSVTILKNVFQLLHLGYLETSKSNFKNFCHSRLEQSWKKCSLAGSKGASHCKPSVAELYMMLGNKACTLMGENA